MHYLLTLEQAILRFASARFVSVPAYSSTTKILKKIREGAPACRPHS